MLRCCIVTCNSVQIAAIKCSMSAFYHSYGLCCSVTGTHRKQLFSLYPCSYLQLSLHRKVNWPLMLNLSSVSLLTRIQSYNTLYLVASIKHKGGTRVSQLKKKRFCFWYGQNFTFHPRNRKLGWGGALTLPGDGL